MNAVRAAHALVVAAALACGCGSDVSTSPTPSPGPAPSTVPSPAPSPSPAPTPFTFTLSGRVTDLTSGAPLQSTTVQVLDGPDANRVATADATGAFRIDDLRLAGFTVRFRHDGYDAVYRGVQLVVDTSLDIAMRPVMQSLEGPWSGTLTATPTGSGTETTAIPEIRVEHTGSSLAGSYPNGMGLFTGTLANASQIGSTRQIAGTMTVFYAQGGRNIISCTGTGSFTGTVNWSRLVIAAPQVTFPCRSPYTNVTVALLRQQ